ncbi:MAG: hypothetical protein V2B18_14840, partial [Pseudomonadota bacterium]
VENYVGGRKTEEICMTDSNHPREEAENREFQVDVFRPEDAKGVIELFRAVYGEGYPIRMFYDADALIRANLEGTNYSVVARAADGKIMGIQNVFRSAPFARTYEVGAGLVLREYRKLGVNNAMLSYVFDEFIPDHGGIAEGFGEPVCNHVIMQKAVAEFRFRETAIEIALMPGGTYDKEGNTGGRVTTLLAFRNYRPRPHRVYLPRSYEEQLRFMYSGLTEPRELAVAADHPVPDGPTEDQMTVFDSAQVARIALNATGTDLDDRLASLEADASSKGAVVFQAWLKLTEPWVEASVRTLRRRGYFLGGLLPRWFDDDGLLMEKLLVDPNFEGIHLYSDRAKVILDFVRADCERKR